MSAAPHVPVLLQEVLSALRPKNAGCYVDATFGAGGYSTAILETADCRVIGIDRDQNSLNEAAPLAAQFKGRLTLVSGRFGALETLVDQPVDGVAFDLGVSSMQLDRPDRGFSFRFDGPLDMRMGQNGPTAADLVNKTSEEDLANIIYLYGEERHSRRVAHAIVAARTLAPLTTTRQLAEAVRRAIPQKKHDIDPATRTFQALRIAVNDEMGELENGLQAAEKILRPGGILVVVTFHSLEDRVVKNFLKLRSGDQSAPSRHSPASVTAQQPSFRLLARKPVVPTPAEMAANPRARSAKLRAAERTDAAAWRVAA